jgi:hypothetical protein
MWRELHGPVTRARERAEAGKASLAPKIFQGVDQAKSGISFTTQVRRVVLAQPQFT